MTDSPSNPSRPPDSPDQPDDMVDYTFGEFRLLRHLGAGGMADVYLAEQSSLNRVVAIKILRPERITNFDRSFIHRFEREAQAAGGLSHPNIVQVYLTGQQDGVHYIVQEYVQGQNLAQHIRRHGPPEMAQGVQWMQQIAEALRAAGDAGIVHRDIKPENMMLTRRGELKVTDFGLAQLSQLSEQTNLTQTGTTMGTPLYMSPEQIQGQKVDHRSDQYSFGITCYHMFVGQPPFSAANSVTVALRHLQDEPAPLSGHRAELPAAVCDTIHRMMAKEADQRFQTPDELLRAIASLQSLSINSNLQHTAGLTGWLRRSLPGPRATLAGLLITATAGAFAGRQWFRPPQLPDAPALNYARRDSAPEQFAAAMLDAGNETAWLAVQEHYSETLESRMAQLHLSMLYLSRVPAAPERADKLLEELAEWALIQPEENRRIRIQALAGRALAARRLQRPDDEQQMRALIQQESTPAEITETMQSSPSVLQLYWNRFRQPPPPQ